MCAKESDNKQKGKKVRGPYNSSLQSLLDIWNVLATRSSHDTPLTAGQIARYLDKEGEHKVAETHASAQTVDRYFPHAADIINTIFPNTVIREDGQPAIIHTYGHNEALHVVLETPNGEPLWTGDMTAILTQAPTNPIPYSSLTRMLPQLMAEYDAKKPMDDEDDIHERTHPPISLAGVVASGTRGGKTKYIPAAQWEAGAKSSEGKQSPTRRFFLESILSPAQWRVLSDLVLVYPYISEKETNKFLSAMKRLAPGVRNWSGQRYARKNSAVVSFEHIQLLDDAIAMARKVMLIYGKYQLALGTDRRWHPELMPMERDGGKMLVEPYALMWSNGYYYLVCRDGEIMRNLRVDRIIKVLPTNVEFERDKNFDPYVYRDSSPVMYPGKGVLTRLRCHTAMLSTLMDFFGTTISEYSAPTEDGYTTVTLRASETGTRLFALQYPDKVEVIEPSSLRNEVQRTMEEALKRYK